MKLFFKKMRAEAKVPAFGHGDPENAGLDLFLAEGKVLQVGQDIWLPTGVAWEPEEPDLLDGDWKVALLIRPRSSMAKIGLDITEGTVDAGYRGEIMVHVVNRGYEARRLLLGDRIAQAVPILLPQIVVEETDELSASRRSAMGFGSSGR